MHSLWQTMAYMTDGPDLACISGSAVAHLLIRLPTNAEANTGVSHQIIN